MDETSGKQKASKDNFASDNPMKISSNRESTARKKVENSKSTRMQRLPQDDQLSSIEVKEGEEKEFPPAAPRPKKPSKRVPAEESKDDLKPKPTSPTRTPTTGGGERGVASKDSSGGVSAPSVSKEGGGRGASKDGGGGGKEAGGRAASAPKADDDKKRFIGANIIQYGLWAHNMGIGAAMLCFWLGIFAVVWVNPGPQDYHCKINGKDINSLYLLNSAGVCENTFFMESTNEPRTICCIPDLDVKGPRVIQGNIYIGALYILYSFILLAMENYPHGYGLYYPNDSWFYQNRFSVGSLCNFLVGAVGLGAYVTSLAGACLLILSGVQAYAAYRQESGDGGRAQLAKAKSKDPLLTRWKASCTAFCEAIPSWNPYTFFVRIYNEDKLSSYFWVFLFVAANLIMFLYTAFFWVGIVEKQQSDLLDGTLDLTCKTPLCHMNRKILRYGPLSAPAAFAKACGGCLNMNCAFLLLPVIKLLLRRLNNVGVSFSQAQTNDLFAKFLARPLTRYIPLQKNIEFHILCAQAVMWFSWGHGICHYLNLIWADEQTVAVFDMYDWYATAWFTGSLVTVFMFIMYTAAPSVVRHAKFEIFFYSHHFFTAFYIVMFIHGPIFFYWTCIPVTLYIIERIMQARRGNKPFLMCKVEWIPPVMAVYFRPVFKEDFSFKEGQYLYLNCPHVSNKEWHPFTISSAVDDMNNGPRIDLVTGQDVVEVPRPPSLPAGAKWNKYCLVSQDWRELSVHQLLDKSDTGYHDYISLHIKVHGWDDPIPRSWTRRFKDYLELLQPNSGSKFPFYFSRRDHRGDITIGKQFGPDGLPIIRVDGPHSAPSEHYTSYGTVMLVGAGIGLTPCSSILSALTKYRWKKNFNPEIVHLYWVVRQAEVDSFQWLVHLLTELSFELKKAKEMHQIEKKYYCEINIYLTQADKNPKTPNPLHRASRCLGQEEALLGLKVAPSFTADQLYAHMMNPTVDSKGQVQKMKSGNSANRFQDIWVWNGRPNWDEIFREVKDQRQHTDIGVCFCGAPVIGADLTTMCEKYSNVKEDCVFTLHKENF